MSLNIKNPEAHRLAKELSELTGESMATAVTKAVRSRLEEMKMKKRPKGEMAAELMRIGRECAALLAADPHPMMEIDDLYDEETGLPK